MNVVGAVAAGALHTLSLKTDGTLWAWGMNYFGQLGDGTTTYRPSPVMVMSGVSAVAVGAHHSLAIKTDGSLWSWGHNGTGQLGDGTSINRATPLLVMNGASAIAGGGSHSLAFDADDNPWAWGANARGQLGDGTLTGRTLPVELLGWSAPPPAPPVAPTNLVATPLSTSRIRLTWLDKSSNETGFRIERRIGSGNWSQIAKVGVNVTTFASKGLVSGTTYSYRVRAENASGLSAYSNTATATTP